MLILAAIICPNELSPKINAYSCMLSLKISMNTKLEPLMYTNIEPIAKLELIVYIKKLFLDNTLLYAFKTFDSEKLILVKILSFRYKILTISKINPMIKSVIKILFQEKYFKSKPPILGEIIGAKLELIISIENTITAFFSSKLSVTMALEITTPAQPPKACKNLNIIKEYISSTIAHKRLDMVKIKSPIISGIFLPNTSLSGPYISCPNAKATKKLAMLSPV